MSDAKESLPAHSWAQVHELYARADAALEAATGALGTIDFPRYLREYHTAMEQASLARLALRRAVRVRSEKVTATIIEQQLRRRSSGG